MSASDKHRRNWKTTVGLAIVLFCTVALLTLVPVVREGQIRLSDTLFRFAPAPVARSRVVLVTIDEQSLQQYGRWPWSRTLLAQLVDNLTRAGASAIGLDILLSEPQSPEADHALQTALHTQKRSVIVDKIGSLPEGPHWIEPLPQFAENVAAVGHTHAVLDADGICRRFQPLELSLDGERFAFAIELAKQIAPQTAASFLSTNKLAPADRAAPVAIARPGLLRIPFRHDGFDTIPAAEILTSTSLSRVAGRPVLVGFGPTDIGDRVATPLATEVPVPGVEIHAQILDGILTGRAVREMPFWVSTPLLLFSCLFTVQVFRRWHGLAAVIVLLVMAAAMYAVGLFAFIYTAYILPLGAMMLMVLGGPILVFTADIVMVERSVTRQLIGLGSWLRSRGQNLPLSSEKNDLSWRLDLLQNLQTQLGSRYELHEALLEATQDLIAIFDTRGNLLLKNRSFASACQLVTGDTLTLGEFRARLVDNSDASPVIHDAVEEREVFLGPELFLMRVGPLPSTTLSPEGGTIVTLSSLRNRVERDRARSEALGFITHELRTPLASIQGFAELIMRDPVMSAAEGAPETIYRESQRLLALISSYLDVLRLDAGAKPIASHVIDLEGLVDQVFNILQPMASSVGMRLVSEIPTPITFVGDAPLISGALLNLVSNAIKYGKPGTDIRVRCAQHPDEVILGVRNEGTAIPDEEIPRLFDSYYRASKVDSDRGGWGLGLAFVKRIAEKHGGWVAAESHPSANVFEIHLPNQSETLEPAGEKHENHSTR
jgi:signal transduction histidine kinase